MKNSVLGNNIAKIRKEFNVTQQSLADAINIERSSLSMIETGKFCPSAETMKKISDHFGVPLGDIFFNPDVLEIKTEERERSTA